MKTFVKATVLSFAMAGAAVAGGPTETKSDSAVADPYEVAAAASSSATDLSTVGIALGLAALLALASSSSSTTTTYP